MELELLKEKRGKAMMPLDDPNQHDIQSSRIRPNTRGIKRDLQQKNIEDEKLTFEEKISKEVEEDREIWLERVNIHLQKLLQKENKNKKMLRNMSNRYITRNKICSI